MDLEALEPLGSDLSPDYLEHYGILPLRLTADSRLLIATWLADVPQNALDEMRLRFGAEPQLVVCPEDEIRAAIRRLYGFEPLTASAVIARLDATEQVEAQAADLPLDDLRALANEPPVVRLVNLFLLEALEARASDVHLEGHARGLAVRYRIDGVLQDAPSPPLQLKAALVSRLKIMADLDISERRMPQDGRFRMRLQDRDVDVRISTLPTLHGESVVLRLLDKRRGRIALGELGMEEHVLDQLRHAIAQPHGIVLATGPTGSGKTTTLYAALEERRTGTEKVLTVEDPVEYELSGVNQVPVSNRIGLTFAVALRALLRQDPDILLVGEIRDDETAEIATNAALTGHMVLSTLHTNDAVSALTRLIDLGVPAFLINSTVNAVLAQRLVRLVCTRCGEWTPAERGELAPLGELALTIKQVRTGRGCERCRGTGFYGRIGLYELMVMTDVLRDALTAGASAREIRRLAQAGGLRSLRDDGIRHIREGRTTPQEVLRATMI